MNNEFVTRSIAENFWLYWIRKLYFHEPHALMLDNLLRHPPETEYNDIGFANDIE